MSDDIDDKPQPLLAHLMELRNRLIVGDRRRSSLGIPKRVFALTAKPLFKLLVVFRSPGRSEWAGMDDRKIELIYTAPAGIPFFTADQDRMFGGLVIGFPMIANPGLQVRGAGALQE